MGRAGGQQRTSWDVTTAGHAALPGGAARHLVSGALVAYAVCAAGAIGAAYALCAACDADAAGVVDPACFAEATEHGFVAGSAKTGSTAEPAQTGATTCAGSAVEIACASCRELGDTHTPTLAARTFTTAEEAHAR